MVKWRTFNSFQTLKLILQPGSDDELEVGHYESSNESVEDEDFAEDVPKIDGNPQYETNKDGKLNNDQMSRLCVASNMLWWFFWKWVILAEFRCPQATVLTALGSLQIYIYADW